MRLFISTVWMACVLAACGGDAASPGAAGQDQPLGIAALGQPQPGPAGPVARAPAGTPTRLALLVGINTYPNLTRFSQLKGAANDVARMHTLLTTRYAFPPENVRVLLDEAATREGILAAFREHLVANARAGDIVVFHFSGHGSRLPDAPGGDETDGIDETLVPTDSDRHGARDIRDDDLEALLAELDPDARITLIFDSCHSGTATRDLEGGRPRSVDRDSLLATAPAGTRAATPDGLGGAGVDYVLISGARADQQARELSRDGHSYGALTYFLTETLSQTDSALTYVDLRDVVQGEVSSHFGSQSPQLEGTRLNDYVFSDESRLGQPYVRAAPMAE
ncbi:MAG: caspase family protein, partial [Rhodothermales bacterium]|nr:caspase family protein [Rhodothermales bacterium]